MIKEGIIHGTTARLLQPTAMLSTAGCQTGLSPLNIFSKFFDHLFHFPQITGASTTAVCGVASLAPTLVQSCAFTHDS